MKEYKLIKAVIVNAATAFNVEINCYSFHLIYGRRDGNGFITIPNWGVCVEAADPEEDDYNAKQLKCCNETAVRANAKAIAKAICELYGD